MTGAVQKPVYLDQIDHLMQVLTARGLPLIFAQCCSIRACEHPAFGGVFT